VDKRAQGAKPPGQLFAPPGKICWV